MTLMVLCGFFQHPLEMYIFVGYSVFVTFVIVQKKGYHFYPIIPLGDY